MQAALHRFISNHPKVRSCMPNTPGQSQVAQQKLLNELWKPFLGRWHSQFHNDCSVRQPAPAVTWHLGGMTQKPDATTSCISFQAEATVAGLTVMA